MTHPDFPGKCIMFTGVTLNLVRLWIGGLSHPLHPQKCLNLSLNTISKFRKMATVTMKTDVRRRFTRYKLNLVNKTHFPNPKEKSHSQAARHPQK